MLQSGTPIVPAENGAWPCRRHQCSRIARSGHYHTPPRQRIKRKRPPEWAAAPW